jgi:putative tricarboxylic transport membrane protein
VTAALRRYNVIADAVLALLGAGAVYGGVMYGLFDEDGLVSAGFLPAVCGAAIVALAIVDLVHQLTRKPEMETIADEIFESIIDNVPDTTDRLQTAPELDIFGRDQKARNRQLVLVIVALVVSIALVPILGLLLSLALLMVFVSVVVERRGIIATLVITAVTIAVFYFVFAVFLGVPLPRSLLGVI